MGTSLSHKASAFINKVSGSLFRSWRVEAVRPHPSPSYPHSHHAGFHNKKTHKKYFLLGLNRLPHTNSRLEQYMLCLEREMELNRMSSVFRFDRHQQFSFLEPKNNDKSEYQVTKINPASSPQLTHDCHQPAQDLQYRFSKLVALLPSGQPDAWRV